MTQSTCHRLLTLIAILGATCALPPSAAASITATMSLNQSAGRSAGSTANLGLDLRFTYTGTDSPQNLTISLPPGLLANASINGGSCLRTTNLSGTACEVGTGTVTATPDPIPGVLNLPLSVSVPVTFYLVPPPAAGDLAGLVVESLGQQLGSPGDIKVRPSGDPLGVGVTIHLVVTNHLTISVPIIGTINAAQVSVTDIKSTFNSLRYPASCPSPAAQLMSSVDSYSDPTLHTVTAPLSVTGCSSLPFAPIFKVTAVRDTTDRQVKLGTTITQTAAEAPGRSVTLAFPASTLAPNLQSIQALCLNLASGSCQSVGSVSATSPLYPTTLTGKAYLTGSSSGLALTLTFPPPFPLTLSGAVNLVKNSATFSGLPDIPLTNLAVALNGGPDGLFLSTCQNPSGTASAVLTNQNGDKTVTAPANFTVQGCASSGGGSGSGSGGSGSGGSSGGGFSGPAGNGSTSTGVTVGGTTLSRGGVTGLGAGRASLRFTLAVRRGGAKLRTLTIELPTGLNFVRHRLGGRLRVTGVRVTGAQVKSAVLSRGNLVLVLRRPVSRVVVSLASSALRESAALKAKARRLGAVVLTVIAENTRLRRTTIRVRITT